MASLPRKCPECRASLEDARTRNGKVRCPECNAVVGSARDDEDDGIRTDRGSPRPAARTAGSRRYQDDDDAEPVRREKGSSMALPIALGLGIGLLGLLLVCGGIAAYWLLAPSQMEAANEPMPLAAERLEKGQVAQAADVPPAQFPVAPPFAPPIIAGPPPLIQPPAEPERPAEPAQEPIRPVPAGPGGAPAAGALPLDELKAASVYILALTDTMGATGSGFVIRAQGGTAYVITNHHVVTPPQDRNVGIPFGPGFRPRFPRPGFGPGGFRMGGGAVVYTAVFRSGMDGEQAVRATLVADDKDDDLAVLMVTGLRNTPRPINYERTPPLRELMPVVAFGFPFGSDLDPKKKNPAITVTKGEVSSLRRDAGRLAEVQLNLDLNPGNSGGPVVDDAGNLIGVAVAKVDKTKIGFAIPVPKLSRLLDGHIDPPTRIRSVTINGKTQVFVESHAVDPLGKVRLPTLLYGLADQLKMPGRRGNRWEGIGGAKTSSLKYQGSTAVAEIAVTVPQQGDLKILAQVAFLDRAGQTLYGEPRVLSLRFGAAPAPGPGPVGGGPDVNPFGEPAKPVDIAKDLGQLLADLKAPDEKTRQQAAIALRQAPPHERLDEVRRALLELLKSPDFVTRTEGALALARCDPREAAPVLAKLLDDPELAVRQGMLVQLKALKDPRVAAAVAARLPSDGPLAAEALKPMGPAAEAAVIPYLDAKYAGQTRFWALNVIERIGGAASIPALEAIERPDAIHVPRVLQECRSRVPLDKDDWAKALQDLKSPDGKVRTSATRRISITPPVAERKAELVSRLETLVNDQSGDVRAAAFKGLVHWAGKDALPLLAPRLDGFDPFGKIPVFEALADLKDESAAALVVKRVSDIHDRANALRTLKAMGPVAEKTVIELLRSNDVFIVSEACKMLAEIGGKASIAPLETAARAKNGSYSDRAATALAAVKARAQAGAKK